MQVWLRKVAVAVMCGEGRGKEGKREGVNALVKGEDTQLFIISARRPTCDGFQHQVHERPSRRVPGDDDVAAPASVDFDPKVCKCMRES